MGIGRMIGGSLISGVMGASSARSAARAQEQAAERSVEEQRRQFDLMRGDTAPYRAAGYNALAAMQYEMGLGPRPGATGGAQVGNAAITTIPGQAAAPSQQQMPMGFRDQVSEGYDRPLDFGNVFGQQQETPTRYAVNGQMFDTMDAAQAYAATMNTGAANPNYRGFQETPGFQYALDQSQQAIERAAAARGMRYGGATMNALAADAQGRQNQEYGNYYNRLANLAGTGQTAVNTSAQLGANMASNVGNSLMAGGNARASGYMGQNAAFQGTMGNLANIYGMQQAGMFGSGGGGGFNPFGGWWS